MDEEDYCGPLSLPNADLEDGLPFMQPTARPRRRAADGGWRLPSSARLEVVRSRA